MQFLLHCHPIVLMDDLAYVWETFHEIESSLDFFKKSEMFVIFFRRTISTIQGGLPFFV